MAQIVVDQQVLANYLEVVREFRKITSKVLWPNGRCCKRTFGPAGTPECCEQVAQGARLYFTGHEVDILTYRGMDSGSFTQPGGSLDWDMTWDIDRNVVTPQEIRRSLWTGLLADTIESASHPTRPVIGMDGEVIGVVAVEACNGVLAMHWYREYRVELRELWVRALGLTDGLKEYYVTHDLQPRFVVI